MHLLLYCLNTIYGKEKKWEFREKNSKNLGQLDAQHSAPAHWTVCMFHCLLLWTVNTYFIWTVTCVTVNELGKDRCNILTSKQNTLGMFKRIIYIIFKSILVLCSSTERTCFPVVLGCQNKPVYYTGSIILHWCHALTVSWTFKTINW